jgi:hypothetical protein
MLSRNLFELAFIFALLVTPFAYSQVIVPANTVKMTFPETRTSFKIHNRGQKPVIIQVDLANRSNVQQAENDGLAILYPKTARLAPGSSQKISVTWRGKMDHSHYYLARVNTLEESALLKNRTTEDTIRHKLQVKVGQAFPLHIEAPDTRPILKLINEAGVTSIVNTGLLGDHIEGLRLSSGQLVQLNLFITPGQAIPIDGLDTHGQTVNDIKLRRFGWIDLRDET